MEINVQRLTAEERQDLINQLHAIGQRPQVVDPMRELVDAKSAHIADLQQIISMESGNVAKFFQLVGLRTGAIQAPPVEPKPDDDAGDEKPTE